MLKAKKGEKWAPSLKLCAQDRMVLSQASMVPTATKLRCILPFTTYGRQGSRYCGASGYSGMFFLMFSGRAIGSVRPGVSCFPILSVKYLLSNNNNKKCSYKES